VEGKRIPAVIDNDSSVKLSQGQTLGIVGANLTLFAKMEDLPPEKSQGSLINVDGREYLVESWKVNAGMVEIALKQNRNM